jgi:hypothetical protein
MAKVTYNERSWAIDVISSIEVFLVNKSWHFKGASGESTISNDKKNLFPDVLLFKDLTKDIIVQGWELKMPDTQINDAELIKNAIKKAKILKRDSFILWNVKSAVLYLRNGDTFEIHKSWNDININSRLEVKPKEQLWKDLLFEILADLNSFFESGEISEVTSQEILSIDEVIDVVLENTNNTAETLKINARINRQLDAEINLWWNSSSNEYGFKSTQTEHKLPTLSMVVLTDWVFKVFFAHILKKHFNEAKEIETIERSTSIIEAMEILTSISLKCNFWNIFSPNLGQQFISETAWNELAELNIFLSTINIEAIEIEILHQLLQNTVATAKRKVAGQFCTPKKLADLLTRLTIDDKTKIVSDPCCGTGTIIKQAYALKEEYEINSDDILNSIWASDKHSFPVQLSTLSMARPSNIGKIINIFGSDVIELNQGDIIKFRNPNNGEIVEKEFPQMDYVVSNLPFINSKEMKVLNPNITDINNWIRDEAETTVKLSGKSDIFAYIPFYLHQFLSENGKVGLLLSNAWLGTDYGEIFLELFQKFFKIEFVVISGKGKWFDNADVVTTILVASKKDPKKPTTDSSEISFCTLKEELEEIDDIKTLSDNIIVNTETENLIINKYSLAQLKSFEDFGIPWSGYFTKLNWVNSIKDKVVNANQLFKITRGERRGQNAMFYPAAGHQIESDYIFPLLKDLKATKSLVSVANKEAFCCSKSLAELETSGHFGAINWIKSFENKKNGSGRYLTAVLAKTNMHWYQMNPKSEGDFTANINYDKSLFISKVQGEIYIDQRMIVFTTKMISNTENPDLYLALLNSTLSMFLIESSGFGRGLGALDLRETKFKQDFKILNPNLLTSGQKTQITEAFNPIMQRDRLPLEQEIESADRINFENTLMGIYGISEYYDQIKSSLKQLYRIRFAVKD